MKIFIFILVIFFSVNLFSQCDLVKSSYDKFVQRTEKYIGPLILKSYSFEFSVYLKTMTFGDSPVSSILISCISNPKSTMGVNSGFIFLFSDGTTLEIYNKFSGTSRESNVLGMIERRIELNSTEQYDKEILNKLSTKSISAIRVKDINNRNVDIDLSADQKDFFKNAIKCLR